MNTDYLVKRLGLFLLILWLASTVNFFLPRLGGQDPIRAQLGAQAAMGGASQVGMKDMIAEYDRRFGLDKPLLEQYLTYLGDTARLEFNFSMAAYPTKVVDIIWRSLPWTMTLLSVTTLLAWTIGTMLGALRHPQRPVAAVDSAGAGTRKYRVRRGAGRSDLPIPWCRLAALSGDSQLGLLHDPGSGVHRHRRHRFRHARPRPHLSGARPAHQLHEKVTGGHHHHAGAGALRTAGHRRAPFCARHWRVQVHAPQSRAAGGAVSVAGAAGVRGHRSCPRGPRQSPAAFDAGAAATFAQPAIRQ